MAVARQRRGARNPIQTAPVAQIPPQTVMLPTLAAAGGGGR